MGHSRLSPSHAATWLNCPGALQLSEGIEDKGSIFAAEGTAAHELFAMCLDMDFNATDLLGKEIEADGSTFTADFAMCESVQSSLDHTRGFLTDGAQLFVEQRVDLSCWYGEEGGGTADVLIHNAAERTLYVVDLKYGRGVTVHADTPQLRIYALGALKLLNLDASKIDKVVTVILQPRKEHFDQREWAIDDIMLFGEWVRIAAENTRQPGAIRVPGEKQCQWCKAKAICPELAAESCESMQVATVAEFEDLTQPPAPIDMSELTLSAVLDKAPLIRQWLDACEAEGLRRAKEGQAVPGFKLVRGRAGNSKWVEGQEDALLAVLRGNCGLETEAIFEMKLLSPTQMQKLPAVKGKKDLLAPFITRSEGAISLAPATDKREEVLLTESIAAEFSILLD